MDSFPYLIYMDRKSLDYGLYIVNKENNKCAERDVSTISVPGRDGDLLIDNGRYSNIEISYAMCVINRLQRNYAELARAIKSWMMAAAGYFQLWDTYDPEYFRLAYIANEIDIVQDLRDVGAANFKFNCKPFKYAIAGNKIIRLSNPDTISNTEAFQAKPYIKITGSGDLKLIVNGSAYDFIGVDGFIEIDSEKMDVFKGATLQNDKMQTESFPEFRPGKNEISWQGNIQNIEIVPRWCCL